MDGKVRTVLVEIKHRFPLLVEPQARFKGRPLTAFKAADYVGFSVAYQGLYLLSCQLFARYGLPHDKVTALAKAITSKPLAALDYVALIAFWAA